MKDNGFTHESHNAATVEGFNFTGIDLDPEYVEIAKKRIENVSSV